MDKSPPIDKIERKCDSCGRWVEGRYRLCPVCGEHMDHRQREYEEKEQAATEEKEKKAEELAAKPPVVQFLLRVARTAETVYMSIVGGIAALLFWLGG